MPKYEIAFSGKVEITAETPEHALERLYAMTLSNVSTEGVLETDEPDYVPPDRDGELADKGREGRAM